MNRNECIARYKADVIAACKGTGLFPSVMMAQLVLESGNGNSSLSVLHNNFFGIKADPSWQGEKVVVPTHEEYHGVQTLIKAAFRSYPSSLEGFKDRVKFLQQNARYHNPMHNVFGAKTPEDQAKALQAAGYATASNYGDVIISIIHGSNLKTLDV